VAEKSQRPLWPLTVVGAVLGEGGPQVPLTEAAGRADPLACPHQVRRPGRPGTGELRFAHGDPAALLALGPKDH